MGRAHAKLFGDLFAQCLERGIGPHHARERVAVGDCDGLKAQLGSAQHQLLGMRGACEESEIRSDAKLGVRGGLGMSIFGTKETHANSPCTNQPGFCGV